MGTEIERKFLVRADGWRGTAGTVLRQGYLCNVPERTVRVRLAGDRGFLTVKGRTEGISRQEFEYEIPAEDAARMLDGLCEQPLIEKTRHRVRHEGRVWEVDEFHGDNRGLVLAEIELEDAEAEVPLPEWVGEEVSHDRRYFNAYLVRHPFSRW